MSASLSPIIMPLVSPLARPAIRDFVDQSSMTVIDGIKRKFSLDPCKRDADAWGAEYYSFFFVRVKQSVDVYGTVLTV